MAAFPVGLVSVLLALLWPLLAAGSDVKAHLHNPSGEQLQHYPELTSSEASLLFSDRLYSHNASTQQLESLMEQRTKVLFHRKSKFQDIRVLQQGDGVDGYGIRILELDGVRQLTDVGEHMYHETMAHVPLLTLTRAPQQVLVIGGGDGGVTKRVIQHPGVKRVVHVELDDLVVNVSKRFFPQLASAFDDPRVELILQDAVKWTQREAASHPGSFDACIIDSTDLPVASPWTSDFFGSVRRLLRPGGVMMQNVQSMYVVSRIDRVLQQHHAGGFAVVRPVLLSTVDYGGGPYVAFLSSGLELRCPGPAPRAAGLVESLAASWYSPSIHRASLQSPPGMQRRWPEFAPDADGCLPGVAGSIAQVGTRGSGRHIRREALIDAQGDSKEVKELLEGADKEFKDVVVAESPEGRKREAILEQCMNVAEDSSGAIVSGGDAVASAHRFCKSKFVEEREKIEAMALSEDNPRVGSAMASYCCPRAEAAMKEFFNALTGLDIKLQPKQLNDAFEAYCLRLDNAIVDFSTEAKLLEDSLFQIHGSHGTSSGKGGGGGDDGGACFPADATLLVRTAAGDSEVALRDVRSGDLVAVGGAADGGIAFAALLTDLHSPEERAQEGLEYLMLAHAAGSLNLTAGHLVATADRGFVPAATVVPGDELLVWRGAHLRPSKVLSVDRVVKSGAFMPLTWQGQILVNGALASSYALPPRHVLELAAAARFAAFLGGWHRVHLVMHFTILPFRAAHRLGLPEALPHFGGFDWLRRALSPDDQNADGSFMGLSMPRYVDFAVRVVTSFIKVAL